MHDIPARIADVLLEVEAALRTAGKWGAVSAGRSPEKAGFWSMRRNIWIKISPVTDGLLRQFR